MKPIRSTFFLTLLVALIPTALFAISGDTDNDGLRDEVETATGVYVSPANTGTNPSIADSDGDSLPDGIEVNLGTNPVDATSKVKRPNIIYILADDLGYGDVGCFWQNQKTGTWKFATPGLDAMAAEGAKLTHHYVGAPICASSRASFLLGQHQGHSDIRDAQFDKALPNNHNIARTLKAAGYRTFHVGKAGLAGTLADPLQSSADLSGHPLKRGFDRFFGYLRHEDGHEHYPRNGTASRVAVIHEDYTPVTDAYVDLFTSDAWTAFAKKTIIEETTGHPDRPFFLYLSYDTPHFYGETSPSAAYPAGRGLTGGIQWTGSPSYASTATNTPANVDNPANMHATATNPLWYPAAQKYVSMIRRMDDSVTDILQTLRDLGIADNTLVIFTSDNGPEAKEVYPPLFQSYAGFEGIKFDIWEGGIRVPTIAWWPGTIPATNQLTNIREIARPMANWDWLATFADLAKIQTPAKSDGTSLVPTLTGQGEQADRGYLYFEFSYGSFTGLYPDFPTHGGQIRNNMQAIRIGDYKGVRCNIANAADPFRIYNVVADPKESTDLSAVRPDLEARMLDLSVSARRKGGGLNRPYDNALIPAATTTTLTTGLNWKAFEGYWQWLPEFRSLTQISFGQTTGISPSLLSRSNDAGLAFEGYLSVPTSGAYTFKLISDSGTCLWIHDGLVIDNDFNSAPNKTSDLVNLAAGKHPIRLYYRHQGGTPVLNLSYSGPGIPLQTIPASAFSNDGPPPVFQLQPDTTVVRRNTADTVDALANDTANYPLSLASAGPSSSGTLALAAGKVVFTPANGFIGSDSFSYSVTGGSATASSVITANVLFDDEIWIPFDEGAGTSVKGVSPTSSYTGTLVGTSTPDNSWLGGKFKKCLGFDGNDDQVNLPGLSLPTGIAPRTFACWVRSSTTTSGEIQTLFSYGAAAPGKLFAVRVHNVPNLTGPHPARLEVFGGTVVGTKPLNDGLWHHLAVVVSDRNNDSVLNVSETLLYVDGLPDAISISNPIAMNTDNTLVPCVGGSNHASNYHFKGDIDDIRIFPKALSAAEVAELSATILNYIAVPDNSDSDGDGATAAQELTAGTDPNDPNSVFRITSTATTGQGFVLHWSAIAGKTYQIEESPDMANWSPVPSIAPLVPASNIPDASVSVPPNASGKRFLRISVR